ncbi:MAG TPA: YbhB/YbcL family Raf kinase inhibitor-like protein [Candidatus Heimdallarchaeota archaeon]|nr:YbhB/YbcL family Raf kinase inhibitor-like protein [Candidatus Heimdallarchaeota archaeon]
MDIQITSPVFKDGGAIPKKYTCDDLDVSPPIEWSNVPEGTKTIVIVCDDPDAPMKTWVHWVIFNIPGEVTHLPENVPPEKELENGARQGMNDFHKVGYGGPCPPSGVHRYFFKLYALDTTLDLPSGVSKPHLMIAMEKHVLSEAHLMGTYTR